MWWPYGCCIQPFAIVSCVICMIVLRTVHLHRGILRRRKTSGLLARPRRATLARSLEQEGNLQQPNRQGNRQQLTTWRGRRARASLASKWRYVFLEVAVEVLVPRSWKGGKKIWGCRDTTYSETTATSRSCHTRVRFSLKWLPGDSAYTVRRRECYPRNSAGFDRIARPRTWCLWFAGCRKFGGRQKCLSSCAS